jgi:hypothetical protein
LRIISGPKLAAMALMIKAIIDIILKEINE